MYWYYSEIFKELTEVICVGFPFSIFKIIFGIHIFRDMNKIFGAILIIWGFLDLIINTINLSFLIFLKRRFKRTCFLNYLAAIFLTVTKFTHDDGPKDLGTAVDVLLSFIIVSIVIGANYFSDFSEIEKIIWSIGVILNVLSAGFGRVLVSTKRLKKNRK